ncbi:putative quinol monooxygenase [Antrihabitans cavernicola]|uniref:Antibiotic biosynthesis monooxygenase n=1 Tax=Antrihabitans cavernicola TaxID=2495913 RepID=A0A5A7S6X0_9NOCA|nr:antibiotic biosynthesis monooxygenase family protein [Spelaeibacter cavernicola]KAA0020113.1 antibiotic biosynthesis monooxygenase [Spelaeibacter cavernicola]
MIVEYIRYTISEDTAAAFLDAYERASHVLDADSHCLGYEFTQGVEDPTHFVVRIEWDSIDGHENGFRQSAGFADFFAAVRPYFSSIDEMSHFDVRKDALRHEH